MNRMIESFIKEIEIHDLGNICISTERVGHNYLKDQLEIKYIVVIVHLSNVQVDRSFMHVIVFRL